MLIGQSAEDLAQPTSIPQAGLCAVILVAGSQSSESLPIMADHHSAHAMRRDLLGDGLDVRAPPAAAEVEHDARRIGAILGMRDREREGIGAAPARVGRGEVVDARNRWALMPTKLGARR